MILSIPNALIENNTEGNIDVYQVLVDKLESYFSPQRNSTFERHLFRSLKPDEGESVSKFIMKLRNQGARCDFGKSAEESLKINLKDKLIDEWATAELKKKCLEKEYTLEEIINLCNVHEQINTQSKKMLSTETTINKVFAKADYSRHQNIQTLTHKTKCSHV